MKITLVVGGGGDIYYELGLLSGLIANGVRVDFIGSDSIKDAEVFKDENVSFYNLRGSQASNAPMKEKIVRILRYYLRLIKYSWKTDSKLFHIQWPNKFIHFDRVFLNFYYKILGKKLIFTAHNVNEGVRDGTDSFINRLSLNFMYKIVDHIIVHTDKMRRQVIEDFGVSEKKVTVIPFGINDMVFKSNLTRIEARSKLGLDSNERIALCFGRITPYKGLEYLLYALANQKKKNNHFRLIIAGKVDINCGKYWQDIQGIINEHNLREYVIEKTEYIPDRDIEVYFKSSDVLMLPYKFIYQSGVLFLSYSFGLPVIATDVGSLREEIIEGETGFVCKPEDPEDLSEKIDLYFKSELFKNLEKHRKIIMEYANERYSWDKVGGITYGVYKTLI